MKLSRRQFEAIAKRVIRRIPKEIRQYVEDVTIIVRRRPSRKKLRQLDVPPDETLLALYEGTPIPDRSVMQPVRYPDMVILFQEPLEEICDTVEELEEEIEISVVHEVAHYVGIDEDRLAELGYG